MLINIELKNFISHKDTNIPFSEGINVFIGKNGAGKSSVIDAITYALYGKHERGNNANIVRNNSDSGSVTLKFSIGDRNYEVYRAFNVNGTIKTAVIKEDGKQISAGSRSRDSSEGVNRKVEEIFGLNYNDIVIATIIKQGELDSIIELKPKEIRELINRLIDLDKLDKAYQEFREVLDMFRERLRKEYGYDIEDLSRIDKEIASNMEEIKESKILLDAVRREIEEEDEKKKMLENDIKRYDELKRKYDEYKQRKEELFRYLAREKKRYNDEYKSKVEIVEKGYKYLDMIEEKDKIEDRYNELVELEQLSLKNKQLKRTISVLKKREEDYKNSINDIKDEISKYEALREPEYNLQEIEDILYETRNENDNINRKIGEISTKLKDYEVIKIKGICPTCDRSISNIDISNKIEEKIKELEELEEKKKILEKIELEFEELKEDRRRYDESRVRLEELYKKLDKLNNDYKDILKQYEELDKELKQLNDIDYNASMELEKCRLEGKIKKIHEIEGWLKANNIDSIHDINIIENQTNAIKDTLKLLDNMYNVNIQMLAIDDYAKELINIIDKLEEDSREYNVKTHQELMDRYDTINKNLRELVYREGSLKSKIDDLEKKIYELSDIKRDLEKASEYMRFYEQIREDIYHKRLPLELRRWAFEIISSIASEYLRIFDIGISSLQLKEEKSNIKIVCYGSSDLVDVNSMSGGEKIAVSLALRFAIASFKSKNTDFIILDEPTTHLDQERRRALVKLISKLAGYQGLIRQLIIITHDSEIFEDAEIDNIVRFEKIGSISRVKLEK
ncbi:MAG: hypothetical protein KatS3mg003_0553 [Candidatus Nitrosocaldaceae archaeon]|nr:MAG: hypothetical protein KatS3mg003_0553 [Candidatus Nitrosocaldaceae archaeon]